MTAEKIYRVLSLMADLDKELSIQNSLESVRNDLDNLVSSPAATQHQATLADDLSRFLSGTGKLAERIDTSDFALIKEMGGQEFFAPAIGDHVKEKIQTSAMTPSVARDYVKDLAERRKSFLSTVTSAKQSLERLGIKASAPTPGTADMAFLIPRDIFRNQLRPFSKELGFLAQYLEHLGEALNEEIKPIVVEQLSSSVPTISLAAAVPLVAGVAWAVDKFLDTWERIEKIRKIRADVEEAHLKKAGLAEELDEEIVTAVEEVVEETIVHMLASYKGSAERKNELEIGIRQGTKRLFGQIERGLTVEFRADPKNAANDEAGKTLASLSELAKTIRFPQITQSPLLLRPGEILEGELEIKQTKKTTKTTTTKKAP